MLLDASDDHRFTCRVCNRPRLTMVRLMPDGPARQEAMAGLVCIDRHPARPGVVYDLPCAEPGCHGTVAVAANERDQHEPCGGCNRLHDVTYEGEGMGYRLTLSPPPDWTDVAGDLHVHRNN